MIRKSKDKKFWDIKDLVHFGRLSDLAPAETVFLGSLTLKNWALRPPPPPPPTPAHPYKAYILKCIPVRFMIYSRYEKICEKSLFGGKCADQ